jgi:hypothetical protein
VEWGTDGEVEKGGDFFAAKKTPSPWKERRASAGDGGWGESSEGGNKAMKLIRCLIPLLFLCSPVFALDDDGVPRALPAAHAHNDYLHKRPLLDALAHGFCSAEADVFLVDGVLLVAHERSSLDKRKTLKALYLDPLLERTRENSGRVHKGGPVFTLLIDIKDDAGKTYAALHSLLEKYAGMLSEVRGGKYRARAVKVVISGNRPRLLMKSQEIRFAGVDGRIGDLDSREPAHFLPMISDRWSKVFKWRGKGTISPAEAARLREIVRKAHTAGRVVRFWATPEDPAVWKVLLESGVDLLNTDDLPGLRKFLLEQRGP